jgi:hypothetical protein
MFPSSTQKPKLYDIKTYKFTSVLLGSEGRMWIEEV